MVGIGEKLVMQTALVSVGCRDKFYKTRALLEAESTRTYITEDLAKLLKIKIVQQQTFSVNLFGNTTEKEKATPVVDLAIKLKSWKAVMITTTIASQVTS